MLDHIIQHASKELNLQFILQDIGLNKFAADLSTRMLQGSGEAPKRTQMKFGSPRKSSKKLSLIHI